MYNNSKSNYIPIIIIIVTTVLLNLIKPIESCKGCLDLDEYNFEKIRTKFETILVKFDVAYPYGDKHDAFAKIAEQFIHNKDLLLAQIGVKDYGENENEKLATKYGIDPKNDLPTLMLFVRNKNQPIQFPKDSKWDLEEIKTFIRDNTDIYVGLPGCLEDYDSFATQFIESKDKQTIIKQATKKLDSLSGDERQSGEIYVKFMEKIVQNGMQFVKQELNRLEKLLKGGQMVVKQRKEFSQRINILKSFTLPAVKDEL